MPIKGRCSLRKTVQDKITGESLGITGALEHGEHVLEVPGGQVRSLLPSHMPKLNRSRVQRGSTLLTLSAPLHRAVALTADPSSLASLPASEPLSPLTQKCALAQQLRLSGVNASDRSDTLLCVHTLLPGASGSTTAPATRGSASLGQVRRFFVSPTSSCAAQLLTARSSAAPPACGAYPCLRGCGGLLLERPPSPARPPLWLSFFGSPAFAGLLPLRCQPLRARPAGGASTALSGR